MSDKPTTELEADLQAKLGWLADHSRDMRASSVKREVREMRAELEARGETLEAPKPPRPERGPVPSPSYRATHRVQMLTVGEERPDQPHDILAVHEDRGDGTALCGQPLTSWMDREGIRRDVFWGRYGEGPVNCGRCARIAAETPGYEPLMAPQGESVRTVSGGAFESNRRRHWCGSTRRRYSVAEGWTQGDNTVRARSGSWRCGVHPWLMSSYGRPSGFEAMLAHAGTAADARSDHPSDPHALRLVVSTG